MEATIAKVKVVHKPALKDTLISLELGKPTFIPNHHFKINPVRQAATKLRPKYNFEITEKGLTDGCIVTRLK